MLRKLRDILCANKCRCRACLDGNCSMCAYGGH